MRSMGAEGVLGSCGTFKKIWWSFSLNFSHFLCFLLLMFNSSGWSSSLFGGWLVTESKKHHEKSFCPSRSPHPASSARERDGAHDRVGTFIVETKPRQFGFRKSRDIPRCPRLAKQKCATPKRSQIVPKPSWARARLHVMFPWLFGHLLFSGLWG